MKHREGRGIEDESPPALEGRVNTGPSTVSNGTESCGEDGTCLHYPAIDLVVPILPSRMLKHGWMAALTFPQKSPSSQADATIFFLSVCMGVGRKHEEEEEEPIDSRSNRVPSFHHPVHRSDDCLLCLVNTALARTRKCSSMPPGHRATHHCPGA